MAVSLAMVVAAANLAVSSPAYAAAPSAVPAVSAAAPSPATAATGVTAVGAAAPAPVTGRPDPASARSAAAKQGSRVEVTGERSATKTSWANPDGTLTLDDSMGPVRVRKDDDWVPLDMDLVKGAQGWAPKASPSTVTFSTGGTGLAAELAQGSKSVRMDWTSSLPTPVVKGSRATYALDATTDLVLTALPGGFEQRLVLKAAPKVAPKIHLPLALTGLTVRDAKDGNGWQFLDAKGEAVFETPQPLMWDAQRDEVGEPVNRTVVSADLVNAASDPQLDLSPSMAWLSDPKTQYPVVIDPTIASVTPAGDTWISESDPTVQGGDYQLGVGLTTGANRMRGLMKFTNDPDYMGQQITAASLKLFQRVGYTCTANPTYAYPATSYFASSTVTWATQPTVNTTATYSGTASFAYGKHTAPTCPGDFGTIDVKKMVAGWASGALVNNGIQIRTSETDPVKRKYFCSMNLDASGESACTLTAQFPTLSVTYNSYPNTPSTPTHTPGTPSATGTPGSSPTTTPTLKATVSDPDGGTVKALFTVYLSGSSTPMIDKMAGSSVASGGVSTLVVPAGNLVNGSTYIVRAHANDGTLTSAAWAAGYDRFTVDPAAGCAQSGSRAGSQPLTHQLTDSTNMLLNPTNGNLLLSGSLLHLRGVGQDLNIGWRSNSVEDMRPTLTTGQSEAALQPWADGSFSYVASDGGCYKFTKSGATWLVPAGINASLTSPVAGTMTLRFNTSGIVNTYVNTAGVYQLTKSADKNTTSANVITYTYTARKLASIKDTQNRAVTFAYGDVNNPTQPSTITDTSLSRTIALVYGGPSGALSKITDATGAVTTLGYTSTALTSLSSNGNQTTFGYDTNRRLTSWTYGAGSPAASTWAASYPTSTKTTITDGNSNAADYTITGSRTTKITDPLGHHIDSAWDSHDNLTSRTDAMGNLTTNSYSPNNMLLGVISPAGTTTGTGASVSQTFPTPSGTDALGDYQPNGAKDAQSNTSTIGYDANTHQANSVTHNSAAGPAIGGTRTNTFQGDSAGTNCSAKTGEVCTTRNGNNNVTSYGYDATGNPTTITPPAPLGVRTFTYDAAGRILTGSDGRGNTARYTYDPNGRTTQVSYAATGCPAATCVSYSYDDAGNLTSRTSTTGVTSFTYDALNRPITKTQAGVLVSTATYDDASNLTSYDDTTGTTVYRYDAANRLVNLAEPGGSCPATPAFPNATMCTGFTYDDAGMRTGTNFPTGQKSTSAYDGANRVKSITAETAAGTTLTSRAYTYQSSTPGNADQALRATMTDQSGTTTYGYDGLNRLTSAALGATTSGWAYDNDGNRTTATKTATPTQYSAFNGADQLCWTSTTGPGTCASPPGGATTYSYDTTGNQTTDKIGSSTLGNSFNVFNQLTDTLIGAATTLTSTYADTSNTERLTAGATSFLNGTLGVTSQTTTGASLNYIRDPYGNLIAMRTAGQSYYYTSDNQGSVIALTNNTQGLAAAYTYDPWGNTTTSTGTLAATNPWRYATSYTDTTTGYLKLGARYYNPTTGRFTQPDPSGQEPNNYAYAGGDPINHTDPTGLRFWTDLVGGVIGLVAGTACSIGTAMAGTILCGAAAMAFGMGITYSLNYVVYGEEVSW